MNETVSKAASPLRFSNQVIVVTGGVRGIGKAIATRLLDEGARVAILDKDAEGGAELVRRAGADSDRICFVHCDVTRRDTVRPAVAAVVARWGRIAGLVNNAGIGMRAPFLELSDDLWNAVMGVNLTGAFIVAQEVCREMAKGGGGVVVNMASAAAHMAHSEQSVYSISKAGLEAMTRAMAFELAPLNIRTNAVAPGTILTEFIDGMLTDHARSERVRRIPAGRLGGPEEVAATVAFLLSRDASYVNGGVVPIDGGLVFAGIRTDTPPG